MLYPEVRYRCFELATILDMGLAIQTALFSVSRQHSYLWNLIAFLVLAFFFATPITLAIEKGKITELSLLVYRSIYSASNDTFDVFYHFTGLLRID